MRSLNPLYMTATAGPSGAFAMEFAGLTEAAFSDLMDDSDFSKSFDDLYGDVGETKKRVLVNSLMFTTLHLPHVKKYDFMSTGQKIKVRYDLEGQLEGLSIDAMDPNKTDAEKQKIEKNAIGIVKSMPKPPKSNILFLRPIRSDSAPNTGCINIKTNKHPVITALAVFIDMFAEFTKYFCM